jgi:hypothetical protein
MGFNSGLKWLIYTRAGVSDYVVTSLRLDVELKNVRHLERSGGSPVRYGFKISLEIKTN